MVSTVQPERIACTRVRPLRVVCSRERSAKWSYLSRAERVRLNTTTKWTRPLLRRQYVSRLWELAAVRGLGALAFFVEAFDNLVALVAVLLARAKLGRQTEILSLLLRGEIGRAHV